MDQSNNNNNNISGLPWGFNSKLSQQPPKGPQLSNNLNPRPSQPGANLSQQNPASKHHRTPTFIGVIPQGQSSWLHDDFMDLEGPLKRVLHRRSASDSLAFIDVDPNEFECRSSGATSLQSKSEYQDFERLDDAENLMLMLDEIEPFQKQQSSGQSPMDIRLSEGHLLVSTSENPSTPSDNNSINEPYVEKAVMAPGQIKSEQEVQSACKTEEITPLLSKPVADASPSTNVGLDMNLDPKRMKRILANRQSAQRSRVRKLQYISELERSVNALQTEVSTLSPQVAYLDHQRLVLNIDNSALKQRIAALNQDKIFKDAHFEALQKELQRLRQLYRQQIIQKEGQQHQPMDFDSEHQQKQFGKDGNACPSNAMDVKCHELKTEGREGSNGNGSPHMVKPSNCFTGESGERMVKSNMAYPSDFMVHNH